jgi:TRAP-type C4-dicarboxylate transport system substrate-binding protein
MGISSIEGLAFEVTHRSPVGSRSEEFAAQLAERGRLIGIDAVTRSELRPSQFSWMLRRGEFNLAIISRDELSDVELFRIFELPYLVMDRQHFREVMNGRARFQFEREFRKNDLELLAVLDGAYSVLANTVDATSIFELEDAYFISTYPLSLDDFDVFASTNYDLERRSYLSKLLRMLEGAPERENAPLPRFEFGVDRRGTVLEVSTEELGFVTSRELVNSVIFTRHFYTPIWLVANKHWLERLENRDRESLYRVARDLETTSFWKGESADLAFRDQLVRRGIKVTEISAFEREFLVENGRRFYDLYATEVDGGADLLRAFLPWTTDR